MSFRPKIAIIGAGPAGCLLARLITNKTSNVSITIFEAEAALDFRSQGGTLDLHEKTGQKGLREAGLFDEFLRHARYDGEAMKLADKNLLCYISMGGGKQGVATGRPEIDRPRLRQILYESLPEGIVKWQHKLARVEADLTLVFANQPSQSGFDLIIGADGAWSKTRSLLSDTKPFYSGIAGHAFRIPDAQVTQPELFDLVNRGSLFSWSDSKSIMAQYMGDGSLNIGTWSVHSENWQTQSGYNVRDAEAIKAACRNDYADWDPRLVAFTQHAEDDIQPRDLYMLPIGFSWPHKTGVTLIGDASHLMTPFAGEGVNLAFADCIDLAAAITKSSSSAELDENVRAFEQDMFRRSKDTMRMTYEMMTAMFLVPNSPRNGIEKYIIRATEGELGRFWTMLLTPVVYAYFFVFKLIW